MSTLKIMTREAWSAPAWVHASTPVGAFSRTHFMVHWDGAEPVRDSGARMMLRIDRAHRERGWAGVGYNFVIDQDAVVWEGRGWDLQGAHCEGMNTRAIGVQLAIGKGQKPTPAMLRELAHLYGVANARFAVHLKLVGHRDHYSTECPGPELQAWVEANQGAVRPDKVYYEEEDEEDAMLTPQDLSAIADELLSSQPGAAGARYKSKDGVKPDGSPELIGLTDVGTRALALLREVDRKLDLLLREK